MIVAKMIWDAVFGNAVGRIIAACLAGLVALKTYGWTQQRVGAEKAVAKITRQANEQGTQSAKRAEKKHDDARQPGSFERLRRDPKTCPDCDR